MTVTKHVCRPEQLDGIRLRRAVQLAALLTGVDKGAQAYLGDGPGAPCCHVPDYVRHCGACGRVSARLSPEIY